MSLPNNVPTSSSGSDNQSRLWPAMPVPSFEKKNWLAKLGLGKLNLALDIVRAFANFTITGAPNIRFFLTDANAGLDFSAFNPASPGGLTAVSKCFQPQTLHGDYVDAYEVIGGVVSMTTTYHILKPPKLRQSWTAEVIDGNNFTYAYATDNQRTATAIITGSPTETQVAVPRFITASSDANALIYAVQLHPNAQQTIGGVLCDWIEVLPARFWCRQTGT